MAEALNINPGSKEAMYQQLIPKIKFLCDGEKNNIANLANIAAALKQTFSFFWVGFYLNEGEELVLGPFQGSIACTRIAKGKGVCGTVFDQRKAIIVPNVDEFPEHIACSADSKSEIVLPILIDEKVYGVLDIDSDKLNDFDEIDLKYLLQLMDYIGDLIQ